MSDDPVAFTPVPPVAGSPLPAAAPAQTTGDSTVAQTLSTALPGEPAKSASAVPQPMPMGKKEAPLLRSTESAGAATAEVAPTARAENEPAREKEMNIERLESQIQEAKVRGPKRVAVAAETMPTQTPQTVAQPVVILPLSEQKMNEAKKKSPQFSVKWLWTWCRRQMKKFAEIIVMYREPPKSE